MKRQHQGILLPCMMALACAAYGTAWSGSPPSSTDGIERIAEEHTLFIGAFNTDCYQDSILGRRIPQGGFILTRIRWGASHSAQGPMHGDGPDSCASRTPLAKRQRETIITYPAWDIRTASVSFQRLNNDSFADIIIHVRATTKGDDGKEQKVRRSLGIFAQRGLDSLAVISLEDIARFQAVPFFAMDLTIGSEMTKPGRRDLSSRTSYMLEPIVLDLDTISAQPMPALTMPTLAMPASAGAENGQHTHHIRIYPNPTAQAIRIEAAGLAAGTYHVTVVGVNGIEQMRRDVTIAGNEASATLDVAQVPSGYYAIRIDTGDGRTVGLYPIIITR